MPSSAAPPAIEFADIEWHERRVTLEYQWVGRPRGTTAGPELVFLHEGLGSISMWRDFPARFCAAHGRTGLVFSRYGYGQSTARPADDRPGPDYLHLQARHALPALLDRLGVDRPWLFGHSDGASIALLHAAMYPQRVRGIVVVAPHIFVEDITLAGIRAARQAWAESDLPQRLARHHRDAHTVFFNWNDTWLSPDFAHWNIEAEVRDIRCPILAVQGVDDEYGTLEQIKGIARLNSRAEVLVLNQCGHSPHRDQPDALAAAAAGFMRAHSAQEE